MTEEDKKKVLDNWSDEAEKLPDWISPQESDEFSKMDTDGDGVITREEFETAQKKAPVLSGEIGSFKDEGGEGLFVPLDSQPKEKMGRNLQFFLGALVFPIAVVVASWILSAFGYMISDDLGVAIQMGAMAIGYIGGAAWGFTSGHQSFAWGVLCSIVILPMLMLSLLFGFCMIMISTGNW